MPNIVFLYILQTSPLLTKENGTQALETSLDDKNDTNKDQAKKPKKRKRLGGFLKYMKKEEPKKRPEMVACLEESKLKYDFSASFIIFTFYFYISFTFNIF